MLDEDVRIQVGCKKYYDLDHYTPNYKYTGPSIYGAFNSFTPDIFEKNESGVPIVAKFMPVIAGVGNAIRRIRIPVARMREEIRELEDLFWKVIDDESKVTVIGEGTYIFKVNEQAEKIKRLIKQRKDFLNFYVDLPIFFEKKYHGLSRILNKNYK